MTDPCKQQTTHNEDGFTLVELLVVLVILALLASIIGPRVVGYLSSSRSKSAKVQVENLVTSLELFHIDVGRYPNTAEGLKSLVEVNTSIPGWNGPYLRKAEIPNDPWGRPYLYEGSVENAPFELYSLGRDGKEGGNGEDGDIHN
jgi:general secretion pathway protein G